MKILFVDDSPTICAIYKHLLEGAGYQVVTANSKDQALQLAAQYQPELGIFDLLMPGGNGDELARIILEQPQTSKMLVSIHSHKTDAQADLFENDTLDFINKDISQESFLIQVKAMEDTYLFLTSDSQTHSYSNRTLNILTEEIKIVLIDDSLTVCQVYSNLLIEQGYHVRVASNKAEILKIVKEFDPHIAIIDYLMPEANGDEITRLLLEKINPLLVVAIFSQHPDVLMDVLNAGAVELISKEDAQDVFLLRIQALVNMVKARHYQNYVDNKIKNQVYRMQTRAIKQMNINLEKKVEERTREYLMASQAAEQAELLEEQARKRLENITNSIPGVVFQFQSDGDNTVISFISDGIKTLHDLNIDDLSNISFSVYLQTIHPDDRQHLITAIDKSCQDLSPLSCEYRIHTIESSIRWVHIEAIATALKDEEANTGLCQDPQLRKVIFNGSLIDISEAKTAQQLLLKQRIEIEEVHSHTRESIEYASLIQSAVIPDNTLFDLYFEDFFTIWQPKDIVGGDIYLMEPINDNEVIIMLIDCTGHGVPGAFVTMLVKAIERQVLANLHNGEIVSPAKILGFFNTSIKQLLQQESIDSISNAGFDGGVLYYNKTEKLIKFSGAEIPLFIIQNEQIKCIKGNRHSIGYKKSRSDYQFEEHIIDVSTATKLYLTTDGYLDQNGGEKGFCFGKKRFMQLIEKNKNRPFMQQHELFLAELAQYQADEERNDDVTMLGLCL